MGGIGEDLVRRKGVHEFLLPIVGTLLLVVGISEPLGLMLGCPTLRSLGRLTSASNSPLVFNQVGGIEFWANRYRLIIHDRGGRTQQIDVKN